VLLLAGRRVALGFEAPIWTPVRAEFTRITGRRGGALAAVLAVMPWCLMRIAKGAGPVATTSVDLQRFLERGGLFLWEAFVSGAMTVVGTTHHDDARLAREAFVARVAQRSSGISVESCGIVGVGCRSVDRPGRAGGAKPRRRCYRKSRS
jgi:hypothetical protein